MRKTLVAEKQDSSVISTSLRSGAGGFLIFIVANRPKSKDGTENCYCNGGDFRIFKLFINPLGRENTDE